MVTSNTVADESLDMVNRLLRLPNETKEDLARLLLDSVQDEFSSLAEGQQKQSDELKRRIDNWQSGKTEPLDGDRVMADMKQMLVEYRQLQMKYRK